MPLRVTTHIEERKILKSDADWISRVARGFQVAFDNIRNTTVSPISDRPVHIDGYLTLHDSAIAFSSVRVGIDVGRLPSKRTQPVKATIHYRSSDLKGKSQIDIVKLVASDFDRVVAIIQSKSHGREHDEKTHA